MEIVKKYPKAIQWIFLLIVFFSLCFAIQILNDDLWQTLFDSFNKNAFVECSQKCGKNVVDKKYGVGYYTN